MNRKDLKKFYSEVSRRLHLSKKYINTTLTRKFQNARLKFPEFRKYGYGVRGTRNLIRHKLNYLTYLNYMKKNVVQDGQIPIEGLEFKLQKNKPARYHLKLLKGLTSAKNITEKNLNKALSYGASDSMFAPFYGLMQSRFGRAIMDSKRSLYEKYTLLYDLGLEITQLRKVFRSDGNSENWKLYWSLPDDIRELVDSDPSDFISYKNVD